ncbi:hypothetical protein LSAT2_010799 [Lamellibrachia satsuma]|nr:hypothetical protein LSAT2_010799 [Lamellibrachia satsuma]
MSIVQKRPLTRREISSRQRQRETNNPVIKKKEALRQKENHTAMTPDAKKKSNDKADARMRLYRERKSQKKQPSEAQDTPVKQPAKRVSNPSPVKRLFRSSNVNIEDQPGTREVALYVKLRHLAVVSDEVSGFLRVRLLI